MKEDLGNGFLHHGVATPVSNHRGTAATVDGDGRNVVLLWLYDHRGCYALLQIDAGTGESLEVPVPFDPGGDCPFASILSTRNRFYTHFNSHFCEYDPAAREFTFHHRTVPQMAMGMTEDDDGRIWLASYPDSGVACFDPAVRAFRDYGHVYHQNWRQYQRTVAADDSGWIYFAVGNTCPHAELPMVEDRADLEGEVVQCEYHGSQFNITTGAVVDGPAVLPVQRFAVKVEGDNILVGPA